MTATPHNEHVRVTRNAEGHRIGECHHRARYSDTLVEELRQLHERQGLGYRRLARRYGISRSTVMKWLSLERRNHLPAL